MTMLATDGVSVTLGGRAVLGQVGLGFRRGRITALLGPNGAGKSTLLDCLAGLRAPDAGRVTIDGGDVRSLPPIARARRIGLLPQAHDVHWNIDVATLVALGRQPWHGRWGAGDADRAAVARAMAATDVAGLASRGVEHLSGGERARVLFARVVAGTPEWLLADEPLASLDPSHQLDMLGLLRRVADEGAGVVVVMHDLNLAARMADDVVLLRDGAVVAAGPAAETLEPARIARAYGVAVEVGVTPGGQRFVLPLARA